MSREIQMGLKWVRNLVSHLSTRPVTRKHSETGLKLSISQERELKEEYQRAKPQKDLEICLGIQRLLGLLRGNSESVTAHTIDVGRMTIQDEAQRCAIRLEEEQKEHNSQTILSRIPGSQANPGQTIQSIPGLPGRSADSGASLCLTQTWMHGSVEFCLKGLGTIANEKDADSPNFL